MWWTFFQYYFSLINCRLPTLYISQEILNFYAKCAFYFNLKKESPLKVPVENSQRNHVTHVTKTGQD